MVTHEGSWKRGVAVIEPSVFVVNESFSKNETDFDLIAIVYLCYSLSYLLHSPISKKRVPDIPTKMRIFSLGDKPQQNVFICTFVKSSREIFQPSEEFSPE